uniref:Uncharacterized protein n=1 Tax=Anguilla anguilla TaxID=7936 RepID=A0A0E9W287_ANGAN
MCEERLKYTVSHNQTQCLVKMFVGFKKKKLSQTTTSSCLGLPVFKD